MNGSYATSKYNSSADYENLTSYGTCNEAAQKLGNHQKAFIYTVYGNPKSAYWWGIPTNVMWIRKLYPDWVIRYYTDNPDPLRDLEKEYPDTVFICDIRNLPHPIRKLTMFPMMMWRFFPLIDHQIDVINMRDTDSIVSYIQMLTFINVKFTFKITMREAAADKEWLMNSTKSFHVMRDHKAHKTKILGGLWGAKLYLNRTIWKKLHHVLFQLAYKRPQQYNFDQNLLGVQNEKQHNCSSFTRSSFFI